MKKTLMAAALGLALVGGQAVAQSEAAPRVGDRLGATTGEASEFGGMSTGLIFAAVTVAAFAIFVSATDDDSESD